MNDAQNPPPPLSAKTRAGYASAEIGINAVETTMRLFLLKYATDALLIPAWIAGLVIASGILWDAVSDPLMGWISDGEKRQRGHRRRFLLVGGFLLSAATIFLLLAPNEGPIGIRVGWLLLGYLLVNTGMTIIAVPHMTMASEMTRDRHQRSVLFATRFVAINLGALSAILLPILLLPPETLQWREAALCYGMALSALVLLGAFTAYRATARIAWHSSEEGPAQGFFKSAKEALKNRAFRPLLFAYMVAYLGIALNGGLATYFYEYRLLLEKSEWQLVLLAFMFVFTASLAFWVQRSKRVGKLNPLRQAVLILGLGNALAYGLMPAGNILYPLLLGALGLGFLVGAIALLDSLLTDAIDYGRLRSPVEAGIYFGVWRFGGKSTRALAIALTGVLLELIGFQPNRPQTPETSAALAWLFGPLVGGFWVLGAAVLYRYRFDEAAQRRVQVLLRRKEAQKKIATP